MASIRKRKRSRQSKHKRKAPQTIEQFYAQPTRLQDTLARVAHALTSMRTEGASLKQAAREFHLDPRTVMRHGASGLRRGAGGRYAARASDRVPRAMAIPTPNGVAEIAIRGSREASKLGTYWTAVQHFLDTGDESALHPFRGVSVIDASGQAIPLITNSDELERLGFAGVLSFESIYARAN